MVQCHEKRQLVNEIIQFIESQPYDPEICARQISIKSLDSLAYRFNDRKLNALLDLISGMSAGEEFHYSKNDLLELLHLYLSETRA